MTLPFPQPYWKISPAFRTRQAISTYLGEVPVLSEALEKDLRYRFVFRVREARRIGVCRLVLDPRCARGTVQVFLNGRILGKPRAFPLSGITPLRLPLQRVREGDNTVELRFAARSAMDGLLSQLYVEGDFDVDARSRVPVLRPPAHRIAVAGWQAAGLPHYMGAGEYGWRESFTPGDLAGRYWTLALDRIVDSAELFVNGKPQGVRAWAPWRWALSALRPGPNEFRLKVNSTAGNKHELRWPDQAQGWIGGGLITESAGAASARGWNCGRCAGSSRRRNGTPG